MNEVESAALIFDSIAEHEGIGHSVGLTFNPLPEQQLICIAALNEDASECAEPGFL